MVRISKQNRKRSIYKKKPIYKHLIEKSGPFNSFPECGYSQKNNASNIQCVDEIIFINKKDITAKKR